MPATGVRAPSKRFVAQSLRTMQRTCRLVYMSAVADRHVRSTQLYRLVWLYSAVHGFAAVRSPADRTGPWPESWRLALGRIAVSTPPLAPAGPPEAVLARLEAELGERLLRLGPAGTAPALAGVLQWTYSGINRYMLGPSCMRCLDLAGIVTQQTVVRTGVLRRAA
jgi:hypothetical protein